jgi:hypothetical protein
MPPRKSKKKEVEPTVLEQTLVNDDLSNAFGSLSVVEEEANIHTDVVTEYTTDVVTEIVLATASATDGATGPPKKRGRKPKGGKIIVNDVLLENSPTPEPNIVMHLKCGSADLIQRSNSQNNNNIITTNNGASSSSSSFVDAYQFNNNLGFQLLQDKNANSMLNDNGISNDSGQELLLDQKSSSSSTSTDELKIIWQKLKELSYSLHTNSVDKKAACFWCTFDFDNPPIFLPKYELNNKYYCYGCFCSPECATAYLFKETIDSSARFERYHMLNHIYSKIYAYKKNIKPAPDPYYTLNKYYGNLTIQEYRRLLKNERLLLIVDKPLCRTLPELFEETDDLIFAGGKTIPPASNFKLRRNIKQSKNDILQNQFNGGAA